VPLFRNQNKFGTLQRDLPPLKDAIDYQLTKAPSLYLFVERFREWVNWDKRVYLSFVRPADLLDFARSLGYPAARVFSEGRVYPIRLDQAVPASLFTTSADILFFAEKHRTAVERFDRRYHVHISSR